MSASRFPCSSTASPTTLRNCSTFCRPPFAGNWNRIGSLDDLLEIVMDLGRIPEARFPERVVELGTDVYPRAGH